MNLSVDAKKHRLVSFLLGIPFLAIPSVSTAEEPVRIIAGPMFTIVGPGRVMIWVQTNRPAKLGASVARLRSDPKQLVEDTQVLNWKTTEENRNIGTLAVQVSPGEIREFSISSHTSSPEEFRTHFDLKTRIRIPPAMGERGQYTFAFGSCSHQERFPDSQPIWDVIVKQKPDAFLFIGDNIYLPNRAEEYPATREEVFKLYCDIYDRQRQIADLQPLLRSTMSFALWDDHDYGPNDSDRTWKWKDVALEALDLYFPNNYGLPDAPGCFYKFAWGDIDVFMLDDRTYRDPNRDPERKTFLGARQLAWLKGGLADSKATFKLIVCGNQMLSDTHPHESWGVQFRPERDAFLDWLWERRITGVIFLAGDRHFAELVRKKDPKDRGEDLWELTSSPLANRHYEDGPSFKNAERVAAYGDGVNVGVLKFDTLADPPRVELLILDVEGKPVIRQKVTTKRVR